MGYLHFVRQYLCRDGARRTWNLITGYGEDYALCEEKNKDGNCGAWKLSKVYGGER